MRGDVPYLVPLALDAQMHDALAALHIAQTQQAKFFAAGAVIEQGREYRPIPYSLQRVRGRGLKQSPSLRVAESRRAAFIAVRGGSFHAVHGTAQDGIPLTEIVI